MTVNPNETHRHAGRIQPYPAVLLSNAFIAALCHLETPPV